ncbi:MAG: CPBP family intramembrane metalloprotease [Chloroflexi bacterium]|nr:CPBP family intramembrane metalloprotease [Chloroflexota bacterium]
MATDPQDLKAGTDASARPTRKEQLIEVAVFLFLVLPSITLSLFVIKQGGLTFVVVAFSTILRDLALVCLILFFLWRNGEPLDRIGWTFRNSWREAALGIALFVPLFFVAALLENAFRAAGLSAPSTPLPSFLAARGYAEIVLAFLLVVVVAVAEETIFRGYLILRFKGVARSTSAAILLSAVIFSLGHGYEGSAGLATVGVVGIVLALVYVWRKSLVAPVVMHFLQDFISIVLLALLGIR